jgi:hypothetical protein
MLRVVRTRRVETGMLTRARKVRSKDAPNASSKVGIDTAGG